MLFSLCPLFRQVTEALRMRAHGSINILYRSLYLLLLYLDGHVTFLPSVNVVGPFVEGPSELGGLCVPLLLLGELRGGDWIVGDREKVLLHVGDDGTDCYLHVHTNITSDIRRQTVQTVQRGPGLD